MDIASKIQKCMVRYDVKSVNELSRLSGIGHPTLRDIIIRRNKHPRIDTIEKIACGFGLTLKEFLFEEDSDDFISDEIKRKEIISRLENLTQKQLDLVLFLVKSLK